MSCRSFLSFIGFMSYEVNTSPYFTAFIILHLIGITEVSVAQIVTLIVC
jgi:hypothetical protein